MIPCVDEDAGDEVDLIARVPRVVAGRTVGTSGEEEVREAGAADPEGRQWTIRPVVLECESVPAADAHAIECAGAIVEAGRPHDDVEVLHTVGRLDPGRCHADHRRRPQIDERDVGLVEGLVVPRHERRALRAERVVLGDQLVRRCGVGDDAADLLGEELAPLGVGRGSVIMSV